MDEAVDGIDEVANVAEGSATDGLLSNNAEPQLDLIEPGGIGRGIVNMVAGPFGQPEFDFGMFVGGIVIDDKMEVEVLWHRLEEGVHRARQSGLSETHRQESCRNAAGESQPGALLPT